MPRKARKSYAAQIFHVMVQGSNKEYIFDKDSYKKKYLQLLMKQTEIAIKIIAYCIMSNHAHLLIYTEKIEDMSKYMSKINLLFALYYNTQEMRVGVVFRNRFRSEPIYDRRDLYRITFQKEKQMDFEEIKEIGVY